MEDGMILVPRDEYEDLLVFSGRVDALLRVIESELTIEIPTLCRILGRDDIAKKIVEEDKRRREECIRYLKEKGEVHETTEIDS